MPWPLCTVDFCTFVEEIAGNGSRQFVLLKRLENKVLLQSWRWKNFANKNPL